MKVADMNQRQKKAYYNIYWAANDLLGGLENTLSARGINWLSVILTFAGKNG